MAPHWRIDSRTESVSFIEGPSKRLKEAAHREALSAVVHLTATVNSYSHRETIGGKFCPGCGVFLKSEWA